MVATSFPLAIGLIWKKEKVIHYEDRITNRSIIADIKGEMVKAKMGEIFRLEQTDAVPRPSKRKPRKFHYFR